MNLDFDKFKPIRVFGFILTAFGILSFLEAEFGVNDSDFRLGAILFLLVMSIWHLATGIGIILRKRWGFPLMKLYVYIFLLGVPIGTLIATRMLRYINENNIALFFKEKELLI